MAVTLELPDELASRLSALLPEGKRDRFAAAAIADALDLRQLESVDCVTVVEQALADMDAGRNLISFQELCREWEPGQVPDRTPDGA